jgi:hypothetical protein
MPKEGWLRRVAPKISNFGDAAAGFVGDKARAAGSAGAAILPTVAPLAGGYGLSKLVDASRDRANAATPDVAPPSGPGQIPVDPNGPKAPDAQPSNWLRDTETGRNIAAATNALGPVAPAANAALRVGSTYAAGVGRLGQFLNGAATAAPVAEGLAMGAGMASPNPVSSGGDQPITKPALRDPNIPTSYGNPTWRPLVSGARGDNDPRRSDRPGGMLPMDTNSPTNLTNYLAGGGDGQPFSAGNGRGGGADRKLPTNLEQLQEGSVYKTIDPATGRPVYSGRNVKEGADIRNGYGGVTGKLRNSMDGNEIDGVPMGAAGTGFGGPTKSAASMRSPEMTDALSAARQAAAARGDWGAVQQSYAPTQNPAGGQWNNSLRMQIAQMENATNRANNQDTNAVALRGQDIHKDVAMAPLMLAAHQRAGVMQAYRQIGAGGKDGSAPVTPQQHRQAADWLKANGYPEAAKDTYAAASSGQGVDTADDAQKEKRQDNALKLMRNKFTYTDDKGVSHVNEGAAHAAMGRVQQLGINFDALDPAKQSGVIDEAHGYQDLLERMNSTGQMGWDKVNPWAQEVNRRSVLPSKIIKDSRGANMTLGQGRHDRVITDEQGRDFNLGDKPLSDIQENMIQNAKAGRGWDPRHPSTFHNALKK